MTRHAARRATPPTSNVPAAMRRLRPLIFWLHLVAGVAAGVIVLVMSVTGVLLTYEKQMLLAADLRAARAAGLTTPAPDAARLPLDSLVRSAVAARPAKAKGAPSAVTVRADRAQPVTVAWGREAMVLVDPYTGRTVGEGATTLRGALRKVTEVHRWLAASGERRETGKAITGASNLAFLVLVLTGAYLWLPAVWTRARVRQIAWFRGGLRGKARDFNWHHVIGVWTLVPLVVIVASGAVISYPWASALVFRAVGEQPPPRQPEGGAAGAGRASEGRAGGERTASERAGSERTANERAGAPAVGPTVALDRIAARAAAQRADWRTLQIQLPKKADAPITVSVDAGMGGQPQHRGTLTFDATTATVQKWEPFGAQTPGRRLRSVLRFAHTGEVLGVPGQTVAGLASLGAVVLVMTGLALSARRLAAWQRRRAAPAHVVEERVATAA